VLGTQHSLIDGQQGDHLVTGPCHVPRLGGQVGEVVARGQGVGVLEAQGSLFDGQLLLFVGAVVGAYHSAKTAWRLGGELFG